MALMDFLLMLQDHFLMFEVVQHQIVCHRKQKGFRLIQGNFFTVIPQFDEGFLGFVIWMEAVAILIIYKVVQILGVLAVDARENLFLTNSIVCVFWQGLGALALKLIKINQKNSGVFISRLF